jgi:ferritin-like metal-binding protein YciE
MAKAAKAAELKKAFEKHRGETEGHVARLENVFAAVDKKP